MGYTQEYFENKKKTSEGSKHSEWNNESVSSRSRSISFRSHFTNAEELEQVFKKFDENNDGKISSSELGAMMGSLGQKMTDEELDTMISEVDADGDGCISLNEFIALNTKGIDSDEVLQNVKEAFSIYDADGNGQITPEELQRVMKSLGDDFSLSECTKMIRGVDRDGDGTINFEEFRVMMMMGARLNSMSKT